MVIIVAIIIMIILAIVFIVDVRVDGVIILVVALPFPNFLFKVIVSCNKSGIFTNQHHVSIIHCLKSFLCI